MENWPAHGSPYAVTEAELVVDGRIAGRTVVTVLNRACRIPRGH